MDRDKTRRPRSWLRTGLGWPTEAETHTAWRIAAELLEPGFSTEEQAFSYTWQGSSREPRVEPDGVSEASFAPMIDDVAGSSAGRLERHSQVLLWSESWLTSHRVADASEATIAYSLAQADRETAPQLDLDGWIGYCYQWRHSDSYHSEGHVCLFSAPTTSDHFAFRERSIPTMMMLTSGNQEIIHRAEDICRPGKLNNALRIAEAATRILERPTQQGA